MLENTLEVEENVKDVIISKPCIDYCGIIQPHWKDREFLGNYYDFKILSLYNSHITSPKLECESNKFQQNSNNNKRKYFIAVLFHNNEKALPLWFSEFDRLLSLLDRNNIFISILESHSLDLSPFWVMMIAEYLSARGIPHRVISYNDQLP
jgi:hypothetical protein